MVLVLASGMPLKALASGWQSSAATRETLSAQDQETDAALQPVQQRETGHPMGPCQ